MDGFGAGASVTQLLQIERLTIGRAPDCDIVLDSPTLARVHAIVERFGEDEYTIRVADGVDAIWVNAVRVRVRCWTPWTAVSPMPTCWWKIWQPPLPAHSS